MRVKRKRKEVHLARAIEETKEYLECNGGYGEDDPVTDDDALDFLMGECGQDRSGSCSKAESEECSFECPFNDE